MLQRLFSLSLVALLVSFASTASAEEPVPSCGLYLYRAEIVRVIDGETVVADMDLGFHIWLRDEHLRLFGIDAPERGSEEADTASDVLRDRIEGKTLYICTVRMKRSDREATGSFGRYLAVIYENGESINDWLVETGHARSFDR